MKVRGEGFTSGNPGKGNGRYFFISAVIMVMSQACGTLHSGSKSWLPVREEVRNTRVDSSIPPDSAIAAEVAAYRQIMDKDLGKVIGHAERPFKPDKPESGLYNLVADALRAQASLALKEHVNIAVMSTNDVQCYIPKGPITLELTDRILPDSRKVVLLELTGRQVVRLANRIAMEGGAPVSGMRMRIARDSARDLLVNQHIVEPDSLYTVAAGRFLAEGGGHYEVLQESRIRRILPITTRQALQNYIRARGRIAPILDGRIRE